MTVQSKGHKGGGRKYPCKAKGITNCNEVLTRLGVCDAHSEEIRVPLDRCRLSGVHKFPSNVQNGRQLHTARRKIQFVGFPYAKDGDSVIVFESAQEAREAEDLLRTKFTLKCQEYLHLQRIVPGESIPLDSAWSDGSVVFTYSKHSKEVQPIVIHVDWASTREGADMDEDGEDSEEGEGAEEGQSSNNNRRSSARAPSRSPPSRLPSPSPPPMRAVAVAAASQPQPSISGIDSKLQRMMAMMESFQQDLQQQQRAPAVLLAHQHQDQLLMQQQQQPQRPQPQQRPPVDPAASLTVQEEVAAEYEVRLERQEAQMTEKVDEVKRLRREVETLRDKASQELLKHSLEVSDLDRRLRAELRTREQQRAKIEDLCVEVKDYRDRYERLVVQAPVSLPTADALSSISSLLDGVGNSAANGVGNNNSLSLIDGSSRGGGNHSLIVTGNVSPRAVSHPFGHSDLASPLTSEDTEMGDGSAEADDDDALLSLGFSSNDNEANRSLTLHSTSALNMNTVPESDASRPLPLGDITNSTSALEPPAPRAPSPAPALTSCAQAMLDDEEEDAAQQRAEGEEAFNERSASNLSLHNPEEGEVEDEDDDSDSDVPMCSDQHRRQEEEVGHAPLDSDGLSESDMKEEGDEGDDEVLSQSQLALSPLRLNTRPPSLYTRGMPVHPQFSHQRSYELPRDGLQTNTNVSALEQAQPLAPPQIDTHQQQPQEPPRDRERTGLFGGCSVVSLESAAAAGGGCCRPADEDTGHRRRRSPDHREPGDERSAKRAKLAVPFEELLDISTDSNRKQVSL